MSFSKNISWIVVTWLMLQASNHLRGTHGNSSRFQASPRLRPTVDIREKIVEWRCYAKCSEDVSNFQVCKKQCKSDVFTNPRRGRCPTQLNLNTSDVDGISLRLACLDECKVDFDCAEVKKCCASPCGPICQNAVGVSDDQLLPPIPQILHIKIPKGHKVEITIQTSANTTIYYHVETRYHVGLQFTSRKLGVWQWQPVEMTAEEILENKEKRIQLCFNLKPGRWYQVRIAAINSHGFRGYSEPSKQFTLGKPDPRPPSAPTDLQVVDGYFNGKHYVINIAWCPSRSNLPVEKYKIIWSLYVKSKDESMISNEAFVRDTHHFEITNLLPDSSYYIQVLAMSISGNHRLKSDKISILFNSTISEFRRPAHRCWQHIYVNQNSMTKNNLLISEPPKTNITNLFSKNATPTYDVRFRVHQRLGMIVQITGFQPNKQKVYELCSRDTSCEHKKYFAIRAKKHSLEFSNLKYDSIYVLKEAETARNGLQNDMNTHKYFSFQTPKCENIRKRFSRMQIKC